MTSEQCRVKNLGPRTVRSPLNFTEAGFISDDARIRSQVRIPADSQAGEEAMFEQAGPRERIYFDPSRTRAAVVTCGGLCPGINNVIRSLFMQLHHRYGVKEVAGIRYGYGGFRPDAVAGPIRITAELVEQIHQQGGTVLGSSRGPVDPALIVEYMERERINILFGIGGDGTNRGLHAVVEEAERRGGKIAVVGVPKTIDNDIAFVWRTFGFVTAVARARDVITCAHVESKGAPNGIGLVKLMGRDSGFIAAAATLASQDVNFTLIPEVPFRLDGPSGFLAALERRIGERHHAVIVVAEGAGQDLCPKSEVRRDASGNILHNDIGAVLRDAIRDHFAASHVPINLRYIDPSYYIRSVPADTGDALYCDQLARYAVDAAMAGKTDLLIGDWYGCFVHVPLAISERKRINPDGDLWKAVLHATGQPAHFM
jgi:6-phosphofructokinase 1